MEQSKWSEHARIIAEDMVNLAVEGEFEVSHFPLTGSTVIDAIPEETLIKIVGAIRRLPEGSIPLGFALLFLMPRKIPAWAKNGLFKQILKRLSEMRVDFSLRTSMALKYAPHTIPKKYVEITVSEYRKTVFLLDNISEMRVPIYRGWSFDAFSHGGQFYRVYNIGTLREPKYVVLSGKLLNNPAADVFGHVKIPESITFPKIFGTTPSKVHRLAERTVARAKDLKTFEDKIEYVMKRWAEFLDIKIPLKYMRVPEKGKKIRPELADRYMETTYRSIMAILEEDAGGGI